ncbi:cell division protein FtsW [Cutibacterium acnes JCM 18916]|nr:cell division protein FtsW [Cutibacterium acnes JCM 18916]
MAEKSVDSRVRRTTRRRTPGSWLRHLLRLDGGDGSSRRLLAQPFLDYYVILATTVLLCGIGALMGLSSSSVYSQSLGHGPYHFAIRQILFLVVGAIAAAVVSRLSETHLRQLGGFAYAVVCLMLVLVLTFLGSDAGKGNQSWLSLGPVSLQPSEFAKFALVLLGASYMSSRRGEMATPKGVGGYLGLYGVVGLLVVAQGDLGTTMIIGLIMLARCGTLECPSVIWVPSLASVSWRCCCSLPSPPIAPSACCRSCTQTMAPAPPSSLFRRFMRWRPVAGGVLVSVPPDRNGAAFMMALRTTSSLPFLVRKWACWVPWVSSCCLPC